MTGDNWTISLDDAAPSGAVRRWAFFRNGRRVAGGYSASDDARIAMAVYREAEDAGLTIYGAGDARCALGVFVRETPDDLRVAAFRAAGFPVVVMDGKTAIGPRTY